jgi:hypothetical protein
MWRMSMFASDEIYGKVARVLVEALGVDEDEITPAATLQGDLGAESIDMLDIVVNAPAHMAAPPVVHAPSSLGTTRAEDGHAG